MLNISAHFSVLAGSILAVMPGFTAQTESYTPPPFSHYQPILERMPFGALPANFGQEIDPNAAKEEALLKAEQEKLARKINMSAVNITPQGETAIGFTDLSAKPPASYYLVVGDEANGWKVLSADYQEETAEIEKDGITISLKLGKGLVQNDPEKGKPAVPQPPAAVKTTVKTPVIPATSLIKESLTAKTNTERAAQSAAAIREQLQKVSSEGGDVRSYMERLRERKIQESNELREAQEAQRKQLEKLAREVASKEIQKQADAIAEEAALKKELALEEERLKALEEEEKEATQ